MSLEGTCNKCHEDLNTGLVQLCQRHRNVEPLTKLLKLMAEAYHRGVCQMAMNREVSLEKCWSPVCSEIQKAFKKL